MIHPSLLAAALLAGLCVIGLLPTRSAAQEPACTIEGDTIIREIGDKLPVIHGGCVVRTGIDLDLSPFPAASGPIFLKDATIKGPFRAEGVVFESPVTFAGTTFEGTADFSGATFQGAADFSGATFKAAVSFRGATFQQPPDFNTSIFQGRALFTSAKFCALGDKGTTPVEMPRIDFRDATDFGEAEFYCDADFVDSRFAAQTRFIGAIFHRLASFEGSIFADDAIFADARFGTSASFSFTSVKGSLRFEEASFQGSVNFEQSHINDKLSLHGGSLAGLVLLSGLEVATLDLRAARVYSTAQIFLTHPGDNRSPLPEAGKLFMELDAVDQIVPSDNSQDPSKSRDLRIKALQIIEKTLRDDGDAGAANDASFRRQALEDSHGSVWKKRLPRVVVSRWMGGYAVRAQYPLFWIALLVLAGWVVRLALDPSWGLRLLIARFRRAMRGRPPPFVVVFGPPWYLRSIRALSRAVRVPFLLKPPPLLPDEQRGRGVWTSLAAPALVLFEFAAHKTLLFALLVALGNAVPGAKEVIDALLPG